MWPKYCSAYKQSYGKDRKIISVVAYIYVFYLFCKYVSRLLITFEDQGKYWHILLHSILIWKEEDVTLRDQTYDVFFFFFCLFICQCVKCMTGQTIHVVKSLLHERSK